MKSHAEQRHRERLDRPVHEQRNTDAAPVTAHLAQGGEVDLHEHRYDHEPDQTATGRLTCATSASPIAAKTRGKKWPRAMPARMQAATQSVRITFKCRHGSCFRSCRFQSRCRLSVGRIPWIEWQVEQLPDAPSRASSKTSRKALDLLLFSALRPQLDPASPSVRSRVAPATRGRFLRPRCHKP